MPNFTSALGIGTGDIIRTSYNAGPYQVFRVTQPTYVSREINGIVVFPWPVISLSLIPQGQSLQRATEPEAWINEIHRVETDAQPRYLTSQSDEIFVQRAPSTSAFPLSLFAAPPEEMAPQPYTFTPGVDYSVLDGELWHCPQCQADFNGLYQPLAPKCAPGDPRGHAPSCPRCGHWPTPLYIMRADERYSAYGLALHVRMVDQYKEHCPERIAYLYAGTTTPALQQSTTRA